VTSPQLPPLRPLLMKDRLAFLALERGRLDVLDGAFVLIDKTGVRTHIPVGSVAALLLEPGIRVSHAAVALASTVGCLPEPDPDLEEPAFPASAAPAVPSGTTKLPSGTQERPSGTREHPSGTRGHPSGTRERPSGTQEHPSGTQEHPSGTREQPGGRAGPPQDAPGGALDESGGVMDPRGINQGG